MGAKAVTFHEPAEGPLGAKSELAITKVGFINDGSCQSQFFMDSDE